MCIVACCEEQSRFRFGLCEECYLRRRTKSLITNCCLLCDGKLREFTVAADWRERLTHKCCYKRYINGWVPQIE